MYILLESINKYNKSEDVRLRLNQITSGLRNGFDLLKEFGDFNDSSLI